ncbi:30S ribosomal protein S17 [Buchnera aphidicola (Tetraneura ulmi)]|uniref:30S ribosomal protein S17 n=1 Tax=Buchnera aphidicola TaxID=9 RepID=UPI003A797A60
MKIKNKRYLKAKVISSKMQNSVVVLIERFIKHNLYKKFLKRTTKIHVHDERNECVKGDIIEICETRPISKTKSWKMVRIIEKSNVL